MSTSFSYTFSGDRVGLIVRGKKSHDHAPGVMEQHADCILSNGLPVGFFGEGNDSTSNSSGLGMNGQMYDFTELKRHRPYYIDKNMAATYGTVSTVLLIYVSTQQANDFDQYWSDLDKSPGTFNILGGNCSTRASGGFKKAGILAGGIPGLDTPNNLYKQICIEKKGKCWMISGYVGFSVYGSGCMLQVDTL